jgi:hypothetical protein
MTIEEGRCELSVELLDLMEHEKVIEQGLTTFVDVGWSLAKIRDGKKYKAAGYDTFELYLSGRWGMSRRHGYRMIDAAQFAELCPEGHKPQTEREARRMMTPKKDHPAPFSDPILAVIRDHLPTEGTVLDPFAGTGRIHEFATDERKTVGIEIEQEWADKHDDTIHGDALEVLAAMDPESVDAIATSPTYGNRMADHHDAKDDSVRLTYRHTLGHDLADSNSGAMQWGDEYRAFHLTAWTEAVEALRPGGTFTINIKNHIRDGVEQPVVEWHIETLIRLGLTFARPMSHIATRGLMAGTNANTRTAVEYVITFRKPE